MLFVSNNKMQRCSFGMQSFLTHGRFVSLRNFFSDKKISQRYCLLTAVILIFLVFVSSGDFTFFFGRHN